MEEAARALYQAMLVGAGGFAGASLRFAVSGLVQRLDPLGSFPYGTLSVNVAGSLVIGLSPLRVDRAQGA